MKILLCLSALLFLVARGLSADEVRYELPSVMNISQEQWPQEAKELKALLDQGKLGEFYSEASPLISKKLLDEDGQMSQEEMNKALVINMLVVQAPYLDYRIDNFHNMISQADKEAKFQAYINLSEIQYYARDHKKISQSKEIAVFCMETEFAYIKHMKHQLALVDQYIDDLRAANGDVPLHKLKEAMPYWQYKQKHQLPELTPEDERFREDIYRWNMDALPSLQNALRYDIKFREGPLLYILLKLHQNNRTRILERLKECGYITDRQLVEFLERERGMDQYTKFLYTPGMLKEYKKITQKQ